MALLQRTVLLEEVLWAAPLQPPQELATLLRAAGALQLRSDLRLQRIRLECRTYGSYKFYETCLFQVGDASSILLCARFGRIGTDGRALTNNIYENMTDAMYHWVDLAVRKEREGYVRVRSDELIGVSPQDDIAVEQCLALFTQHRQQSATRSL